MQVVVLCGGMGSRLGEVTKKIPKSLVSIRGKPFLEYIIDLLRDQKFKDYLFLTSYLGDEIRKYFSNGSSWNIKIKYSRERFPLGTGGALKNAENLLDEKFLLIYGDSFLKIDYHKLIDDFKKNNCLLELAIYKDQRKLTQVSPNICWNKKNRQIVYYSKTKNSKCNYVDAGAIAASKKILYFFYNKFISLENDIFPILIKKRKLMGYEVPVRFYDIGTPERLLSFEKNNFMILSRSPLRINLPGSGA